MQTSDNVMEVVARHRSPSPAGAAQCCCCLTPQQPADSSAVSRLSAILIIGHWWPHWSGGTFINLQFTLEVCFSALPHLKIYLDTMLNSREISLTIQFTPDNFIL